MNIIDSCGPIVKWVRTHFMQRSQFSCSTLSLSIPFLSLYTVLIIYCCTLSKKIHFGPPWPQLTQGRETITISNPCRVCRVPAHFLKDYHPMYVYVLGKHTLKWARLDSCVWACCRALMWLRNQNKKKMKRKTQCERVKVSKCAVSKLCFWFSRPLKRDQDIGSDTDFTQSSMEDISMRCSRRQEDTSICVHRSQEQKHYRAGTSQPRRPVQRKVQHSFTQSLIRTFIHLGIWGTHWNIMVIDLLLFVFELLQDFNRCQYLYLYQNLHTCQLETLNDPCSSSAPSRGWERNAMPPPLLSPPQQVCPLVLVLSVLF